MILSVLKWFRKNRSNSQEKQTANPYDDETAVWDTEFTDSLSDKGDLSTVGFERLWADTIRAVLSKPKKDPSQKAKETHCFDPKTYRCLNCGIDIYDVGMNYQHCSGVFLGKVPYEVKDLKS